VATGLQDRFDWAGVAAAGIAGGVSAFVGQKLNIRPLYGDGASQRIRNIGANLATGMAGNIANAATRSVIDGTDFGDNIMAALPDTIANTIGNLVADGIGSMDRNGHAAELLKEIAPDGATPEQRQHVKEMLKVGVSDSDILNLYARELGVGQGLTLNGGRASQSSAIFGADHNETFAKAAWDATIGAILGGADSVDSIYMKPESSRHLNGSEITELTGINYKGEKVGLPYTHLTRKDLGNIYINSRTLLNKTAITPTQNIINFPDEYARRDFTQSDYFDWLVHEVYHSFQYSIGNGSNVWRYGMSGGPYVYKVDGSDFGRYNTEQQASMMQDLYLLEHGKDPIRTTKGSVSASNLRSMLFPGR
jgi:hypothetical protein